MTNHLLEIPDAIRNIQWIKEVLFLKQFAKLCTSAFQMRIAEILNNLRNQVSCILEKEECNKIVFYRMLKTFFFVSKQLDILHFWSTIKALQIVFILIVKSILTGNAYRYISLTLLIAYFALVCYIITNQFIRLKQQYEDLRISCSIPDKNSPSSASSANWYIFQKSSKHLGLLLNKDPWLPGVP